MLCEIRGVPRSERNSRIEGVLGEVKMQDWVDKKTGSFSKGMKQRVNVAATLLGDPDVVILDEPTTGLDPRGMSEVRDIVKSLRNRLVFMSSHLLAEVTEVCDEVALIDHGKLLVYDSIGNVTARFSGGGGSVEIGFASDPSEEVRSKIASIAGVLSVNLLSSRQLIVKFDHTATNQESLFNEVAALRAGVTSLHESTSGLEDAYLSLIKETL